MKLSGRRDEVMWKATPLSVNDNLNSAAKIHECLIVESIDLVQKFSLNGYLDFEVKIERYSEEGVSD